MIILVHNNLEVINLYFTDKKQIIDINPNISFTKALFDVARLYPKELLVWVYKDYEPFLNIEKFGTIFHHKLVMVSYAVNGQYSISKQIGYIEQKPYTNVSKDVSFPTWLMSSDVGGMYSETLNTIKSNIKNSDFGFVLSSIAKQAMPKGLFCYSEPLLLKPCNEYITEEKKRSTSLLFKFVRQHYKLTWLFNLLLCFIIYENKLPLISFIKSLFPKSLNAKIDLSKVNAISNKKEELKKELDVIIPTLGREQCLYNVLKDLSQQTVGPINVIIVEQNPNVNSSSTLNYLKTEKWPFKIKHHFTHQTGACNARNIAINLTESEWAFLADDDIRFEKDLIEKAFDVIDKYGNVALNMLCLQPDEKQSYFYLSQTDIFGSGTSILKSSLFKNIKFDMSFEFGFGEDSDFGMQIRNLGTDIIFIPGIKITHLKAPIGGFRNKVKQQWEDEVVQPKPSPTMMLFAKKHYNEFQIKGYKYVMFVKYYKNQTIRNPFKYIRSMNAKWKSSEKWAKILQLQKEAYKNA